MEGDPYLELVVTSMRRGAIAACAGDRRVLSAVRAFLQRVVGEIRRGLARSPRSIGDQLAIAAVTAMVAPAAIMYGPNGRSVLSCPRPRRTAAMIAWGNARK